MVSQNTSPPHRPNLRDDKEFIDIAAALYHLGEVLLETTGNTRCDCDKWIARCAADDIVATEDWFHKVVSAAGLGVERR